MKYMNESSLEELFASAVLAFPHTTMRQHAVQPIIIETLHWTPFVGMKTLFIKGHARNEDRHYNTIILFKGVDYTNEQVKIKGSDGKFYRFGKLSLENTDVLVRCSCPDFKWRFNFYDHLDKSLYGPKRSKYEGVTGVPANPKQMPGMCKHLMATTKILSNSGIFQE